MPSDADILRKLTPAQVAQRLAVTSEKVVLWVRTGQLRAIDVSRTGSGRPRYRIDLADLKTFEQSRQVQKQKDPAGNAGSNNEVHHEQCTRITNTRQ